MPILNRIAELARDAQVWRRDLHQHPELLFEVHRTAAFVAEQLRAFGCDEVITGLGRTGVVGVLKGRLPGTSVIGLRADMDALPMQEETDLPYGSQTKGLMHACGHDGHTAMLLGAARYLAETRNFAGTAIFIFQPAEENGGAGARAMIEDGLMQRFGIQEVYALHNQPGLPIGAFALNPGPILASSTRVEIEVRGTGGHAARPHLCIDPIVLGAQLITNLQSVISRSLDPLDGGVLSITQFHSGTAFNVIPETAQLAGTLRCLNMDTQRLACARIKEVAEGLALANRAQINVTLSEGYPVTKNHAAQAQFAQTIAREIVGDAHVDGQMPPSMSAEDFAFMLQARPGAFLYIGNGESAGLHHPKYDFNDEVLAYGMTFWARLVERRPNLAP